MRPGSSSSLELEAIMLVHNSNLGDERVVRVRVGQERAYGEEHLWYCKGGAPFVFQDIQANTPVLVYVWVEYLGFEWHLHCFVLLLVKRKIVIKTCYSIDFYHDKRALGKPFADRVIVIVTYLGWLERIVRGEMNVEDKDATGIRATWRTDNCSLPMEQVFPRRPCTAWSERVLLQLHQFLLNSLRRHHRLFKQQIIPSLAAV